MNRSVPEQAWSWQRVLQLAGLIGIPLVALVVTVMAWRFPVDPDGPATPSATGTAQSPSSQSSPSRPAPAPVGQGRPLVDLEASAGRANTAVDGGTVSMTCGTGESHDRYREVEYLLRGAYQRFTATVTAEEVVAPEVRTQLEVFSDDRVVSDTVLVGAESVPVSAELDGGQVLKLRLTCQHRDTVLVISDGTVRG